MKQISKETLQLAAQKAMIKITNEDLDFLYKDFDVVLKQFDLINEIDGLEELEPMVYPFEIECENLREDNEIILIDKDSILKNAPKVMDGQIELPKVIEK